MGSYVSSARGTKAQGLHVWPTGLKQNLTWNLIISQMVIAAMKLKDT